MITLQLDQVNFAIADASEGHALVFQDPANAIRCVVPFDDTSWENFKRHVAADGKLPALVIPQRMAEKGDGVA